MIKRCVSALVFAGILVFAIIAGIAKLSTTDAPELALSVLPGFSDARAAQLSARLTQRPTLDRRALNDARDIHTRAPLSASPLILHGLAAAQDDNSGAESLLKAALVQAPRNIPLRAQLAQRALGQGDLVAAIAHLDRLTVIDRENYEAYVTALASLTNTKEGQDIVLSYLEDEAVWSNHVVDKLNKDHSDYAFLFAVNLLFPSKQHRFVHRLASEIDIVQAFIVWLDFLPAEEVATFQWPYNPSFEERSPPPPFNWRLARGKAEFGRADDGLRVTYLGRDRPRLAEQTLLLGPGAYRFAAVMDGEARQDGGGLSWRLTCESSGAELGSVVVRALSSAEQVFDFGFTVPDTGCRAQRLGLWGETGEFTYWARARVSSVAVIPVETGEAAGE